MANSREIVLLSVIFFQRIPAAEKKVIFQQVPPMTFYCLTASELDTYRRYAAWRFHDTRPIQAPQVGRRVMGRNIFAKTFANLRRLSDCCRSMSMYRSVNDYVTWLEQWHLNGNLCYVAPMRPHRLPRRLADHDSTTKLPGRPK